nr:10066_t:CDS:2 [Entrophospora candida]
MTKKQDKNGSKQSNKLETLGNEVTMNLNNILYQNIQASPYFKQLYELKTYHEVIDEIYNHEPFLKGTTASTAFCLLYKLWTLRLTVKQVSGLIEHPDSPYIRALGFLYLRYVCKPENLWEWFEAYLDDEEELQVQGGARPIIMTIGKICSQLLTEQKWLGTILPRIPVPIARDIDQRLKEYSSQDLPPTPLPPSSLTSGFLHHLLGNEPRPSDRAVSRRGGEDEEREHSSRRSRTRSRSIEQGGGSSRSHRYRDYDYDRGRRDHDRYRGDRERKRSRSDSRERYHHHRRHRSSSRDNKERDYDSGRRSSGNDYDRNKRRHDDERSYERRRSRSPKN